ncbi:FGGY-family carbohydrate kinase, partial [Escherichia coli]|nr:FGGY-family carbohydrate kinase [Escherichia coli]
YRAGQTGLLRLPWDNGDRSVRADPRLRGVTLGWRLHHSAADEMFAAIEGIGFNTRIVIERMIEHGVSAERVINGGGIAQRSPALNRAFA